MESYEHDVFRHMMAGAAAKADFCCVSRHMEAYGGPSGYKEAAIRRTTSYRAAVPST